MRNDDPADATGWPDLSHRIEELGSRVDQTRTQAKKRRKLLGKVRHKLSLIDGDPTAADDHWRILVTTVDEFVAAFRLRELIWIETREHQSIESFEPSIAQSDVAVVLLAIRWSSHSFGDVKAFCDRYGKPLVRLPGGYNPNQVAAQIMAQCSERLKTE